MKQLSARLLAVGWVADAQQFSATWRVPNAHADADVAEATDVVIQTLSVYGVEPGGVTRQVFASTP